MKARLFFVPLAAAMAALIFYLAITGIGRAEQGSPLPQVVTVDRTVDGMNVDAWAHEAERWHRAAARYRQRVRSRWQPTVGYALRLASAVYRLPQSQLRRVAYCESQLYVFASNGRHQGLFQLGWRPFGTFSPFDPVANALSAAATVRRDGGWRQWSCKP